MLVEEEEADASEDEQDSRLDSKDGLIGSLKYFKELSAQVSQTISNVRRNKRD